MLAFRRCSSRLPVGGFSRGDSVSPGGPAPVAAARDRSGVLPAAHPVRQVLSLPTRAGSRGELLVREAYPTRP